MRTITKFIPADSFFNVFVTKKVPDPVKVEPQVIEIDENGDIKTKRSDKISEAGEDKEQEGQNDEADKTHQSSVFSGK